MPEKLSLLPDERSALAARAAVWNQKRGRKIPVEYIEKDFWVTEALRSLANPLEVKTLGDKNSAGTLRANIVFKGGTSLSKAHGLINRFSEDIDLFVEITFQRDDVSGRGQVYSQVEVGDARADRTFALIAQRISSDIGLPVDKYSDKDARTGTRRAYAADYANGTVVPGALRKHIQIKLTRMGNPQPNESREIESLLAEYIREDNVPDADFEELAQVIIKVLSPHRTLIEKLCAVEHTGLASVGQDKGFVRMARHFYDIYALLNSNEVVTALKSDDVEAMAKNHFELIKEVRRETGARPEGGFAESCWMTNENVISKAREAYEEEVPGLAYSEYPSFEQVQEKVRASAAIL